MSFSQEALESLTNMFANAIQKAMSNVPPRPSSPSPPTATSRSPPFSMIEYKTADQATVEDYFKRFDWALQLSKIVDKEHHQYARVHMGAELNNALKILVHPRNPEEISYAEMKNILTSHFDQVKNKYAESIKFRRIMQEKGETVANFALRLKQGAASCNYGEFLNRMLIEQFLHGLECRNTCDEIIAKKPESFNDAYEIAHSLEATKSTTMVVQEPGPFHQIPENMNKLGYSKPQMKKNQNDHRRKESNVTQNRQLLNCYGCGGPHFRSQCKFRDEQCRSCGKKGHISKVCRSKMSQMTVHESSFPFPAETNDSETNDFVKHSGESYTIKTIKSIDRKMIPVKIDGQNLKMELDTGAPCGIISVKTLRSIKPNFRLQKTDRQFASYTHHKVNCVGRLVVNAEVGKTLRKMNLYVVEGDFDTLFGREWIAQFAHEINFVELFSSSEQVNSLTTATPDLTSIQRKRLDSVLVRYDDIFSEVAGKLTGPPATLHLKPGATPIFAKAREIPLALRDTYAKEIDAKIASGLYTQVEYSEWASTTHVVAKKNGKIRITGNYKPTLNPRMIIDEYPIPRAEHLFNQMKGATIFCHLDITDAYSHLTVDEEFSHALTLNTPTHGLIRPTRAVYGAANIPAIWQRRMETVLQEIPNVRNFFDDILIYAENFDHMLMTLETTLERLKSHGLRLNRSKCVFASPAVEFLGHMIDSQGIHKSDKHIAAVRDAPKPSTPEELQLFLGKATYYSAFIAELSTRDKPLRDMLRKEYFKWTAEAEEAYIDIKNTLVSSQVLMPYDPKLPLLLATDASKTGLGAVLSHRLSNGQERPIAYASRTMSATEQRYPQMDKEALAIVWAVQKFFMYLYARHWTLITDHKPLAQILHPEKSLPILCISRMANYADFLGNFDYDVIFKTSKENANADFCSRTSLSTNMHQIRQFSIQGGGEEILLEQEIEFDAFDDFIIRQIKQLPIRAEQIARETRKDTHLGKILRILESGQCLIRSGYKAPESNYRLAANCLIFEHRVVIPTTLRNAILNDLHTAHLGMVKMKGLARSFVFWPGIDADIERTARTCNECARHAHAPPKFQDHHWEYPKGPWERIHIDYAGPYAGVMLLIISDAYSKWLEVKITNTMTTSATIAILDELFAAYGVPTTIVSDNGTNFTSAEFETFWRTVGVKFHKLIAPYHPSTNGQAERNVQTVKDALKSMGTTRSILQQNLNNFLRQYRKAPHSTTGQPPAQLFLGRTLRTRLDLVKPDDLYVKITEKQRAQFNPTFRILRPSQTVFFLSGNPRMDKWIPGTITACLGDLHYEIDYFGKRFKRHIDQIRRHDQPIENPPRKVPEEDLRRTRFYDNTMASSTVKPQQQSISLSPIPSSVITPIPSPAVTPQHQNSNSSQVTEPTAILQRDGSEHKTTTPSITPRRSTRPRRMRLPFTPK